jgi:hypothetical protein
MRAEVYLKDGELIGTCEFEGIQEIVRFAFSSSDEPNMQVSGDKKDYRIVGVHIDFPKGIFDPDVKVYIVECHGKSA